MTRINTGKEKPEIKLRILVKVYSHTLIGQPLAWRELYKFFENNISEPTFSKYIKGFLNNGLLEKKAIGDKIVFVTTQKGYEEYGRLLGFQMLNNLEQLDKLGLFTKGLGETEILNFLKKNSMNRTDTEESVINEANNLDISTLSIFASGLLFSLSNYPIEIKLKVKTDPKKLFKKINEDIERKKNPSS